MEALPLITALIAGFAHALEADHMAAVTTFVSRRPRPLEALGFGLRWGLGHSAAILAVGGVLIALGLRLPEGVARGLEFGVGTLLLALGLWLLWGVLHERAHRLAGAGGHAHPHPHAHGGGSLWVGVAHGLAGTAPLIAVLPVAMTRSPWMAGGYLLLFGVGTTVAMGLYALVAGLVFHHAGSRVPALGIVWMHGAMGA
ncbi:MAG TPA: hypothetical protein VHG91_00830 [Longimicrobium sp.]|nr:hypothetical protein [Longimicrobium sp.]